LASRGAIALEQRSSFAWLRWPLAWLREWIRVDRVAARDSISFPELVWAHLLRQKELRDGDLNGPAEVEYRRRLELFVREHGEIVQAYWCTKDASAVALTEKVGRRVAGVMWRRHPTIRFHAATDWATQDVPEIAYLQHTCETLAVRVGEVLRGTSERVALQWLLSVSDYLLGVVDQTQPTKTETAVVVRRARAELGRIEGYYHRAGEKAARLVYAWGMMLGVGALAIVAGTGVGLLQLFGSFDPHALGTQNFFACYGMGAVGALVSVLSRMATGGSGSFYLDYEVGRRSLRRLGSFRPVVGAIFALVLYLALRGDLLQIHASGPRTTYFYAALAFLAGFSERKAKILLDGADRMLGNEADSGRQSVDRHGRPARDDARTMSLT